MRPRRPPAPYFLSLEDVPRGHFNEEQTALFSKLKMLSSSTQRSYAAAFRGYMERRPFSPANAHSARAWICGVRWGCELNSLHPDSAIADEWRETLSQGISIPEIEFYDDLGSRYIRVPAYAERQGRRRHRLPLLPHDFVSRLLAHSKKNSRRDLHFALVALSLTGCRPCELSSMGFDFTKDSLSVTIACAKERGNEKEPRHRTLTVKREGFMFTNFLDELEIWLEEEETTRPFVNLKAAAMNNLCRRLSRKLWPLRPLVNPSCFRCLFIADLKSDGVPREQIASQVGHLATRSASRYGTARQGRTGRRGYLHLEQDVEKNEAPSRPRG